MTEGGVTWLVMLSVYDGFCQTVSMRCSPAYKAWPDLRRKFVALSIPWTLLSFNNLTDCGCVDFSDETGSVQNLSNLSNIQTS